MVDAPLPCWCDAEGGDGGGGPEPASFVGFKERVRFSILSNHLLLKSPYNSFWQHGYVYSTSDISER